VSTQSHYLKSLVESRFFEVKKMAIGEKLWEGKAKTMGMTIKGAHADGVMIEYTWMHSLKVRAKQKTLMGKFF
jgi:hypothetical protein